MIEAVNSVVANAPLLRGNAEAAASRALAANADNTPVAATPQAPYISPYIHLDVNYDMAVLQIRNAETGDVEQTIPSDASLELRSRARTATTEALVSPVQAQDVEFSPPQQSGGSQQAAIAALSTGSRTGVSTPGASSGLGISLYA